MPPPDRPPERGPRPFSRVGRAAGTGWPHASRDGKSHTKASLYSCSADGRRGAGGCPNGPAKNAFYEQIECHRLLDAWAADVWPLVEDDPDVIRWAEALLAAPHTKGILTPIYGGRVWFFGRLVPAGTASRRM